MAVTLRRVCKEFLEWAGTCLRPATVDVYRRQLEKFQRATKNKQVGRLRPVDLTMWAKTWHEMQAVVRVFNWAVSAAKLCRKNPFAGLRLPSRGFRRRTLTPQQVARLMRRAGRAGRLFLLALKETMARPQEIRHATFDQLHSEDPSMPVWRALTEGKALIVQYEFKDGQRRKDQSRPRVLLVSRRLGRAIARRARSINEWAGPIFPNSRDKQWTRNAVRCLMRRLRRALGMQADERGENVVAYSFRHSLATWAVVSGMGERIVADILGHVETRTTSRYFHIQVKHLRQAMERFRDESIEERRRWRRDGAHAG